VLEEDVAREHVVQLYGADAAPLARNVAAFLADGIRHGHEAVIVASPAQSDRIVHALHARGVPTAGVTVLDADATLASFLVHGFPDALRFDDVVGRLVNDLMQRSGSTGVSAYGEMVGLLWTAKKYPAAIRLEQLWCKVMDRAALRLFCGYPIDIFDPDFNAPVLNALFSAHGQLLSEDSARSLESALSRALDEVLGEERHLFDDAIVPLPRCAFPKAEATILRLRALLPQHAEDVLARAKSYYAGGT
jgi:hypothetical protein